MEAQGWLVCVRSHQLRRAQWQCTTSNSQRACSHEWSREHARCEFERGAGRKNGGYGDPANIVAAQNYVESCIKMGGD
eukprot:4693458-Pyramimonas_sp.AAC.1